MFIVHLEVFPGAKEQPVFLGLKLENLELPSGRLFQLFSLALTYAYAYCSIYLKSILKIETYSDCCLCSGLVDFLEVSACFLQKAGLLGLTDPYANGGRMQMVLMNF